MPSCHAERSEASPRPSGSVLEEVLGMLISKCLERGPELRKKPCSRKVDNCSAVCSSGDSDMRLALRSPHALGRLSRSSAIRLRRWNLGEQVCSLPRSALDLEAATQVADTLLH